MKLYLTCLILTSLSISRSIFSMELYDNHDATESHQYEHHAIEINSIILQLFKNIDLGKTAKYTKKFMHLIKALSKPDEINDYNSYKIEIQKNLQTLIDALKQTDNISEEVRKNLNAESIINIIEEN